MIGKVTRVAALADFTLALAWDDGRTATLDLNALIHARAVLAPLRDPAEFGAVRLSDDGWSIAWPCGIDFGAPQLRVWADEQAVADPVE